MTLKPVTPPDRTAVIKALVGKWEKKNRSKSTALPADKNPGKSTIVNSKTG